MQRLKRGKLWSRNRLHTAVGSVGQLCWCEVEQFTRSFLFKLASFPFPCVGVTGRETPQGPGPFLRCAFEMKKVLALLRERVVEVGRRLLSQLGNKRNCGGSYVLVSFSEVPRLRNIALLYGGHAMSANYP